MKRLFHSKHFPECYSECPDVTFYSERMMKQGMGREPAVAIQVTLDSKINKYNLVIIH